MKNKHHKHLSKQNYYFHESLGHSMELPAAVSFDVRVLKNLFITLSALVALIAAGWLLNLRSVPVSPSTPAGSIVIEGSSVSDLQLQSTAATTAFQDTQSTPQTTQVSSGFQPAPQTNDFQNTWNVSDFQGTSLQ